MSSRPLITDGFSARRVDAVTGLVAADGVLDLQSAPRLRRVLSRFADEGCTQIVVDLSRVTFMDSTGLAVLLGAKRRLGTDGTLAVAAAQPQVLQLLELTGLERAIQQFETADAAIASLTGREGVSGDAEPAPVGPLPLTPDAAVALGIAATAMPFADSREDQVERWLHALLLHGQAGLVLASVSFSEAAVARADPSPAAPGERRPSDREVVDAVIDRAHRIAVQAGAAKTGTAQLLLAVIDSYGSDCERVLEQHGVNRRELVALLEADPPQEHA